MEKDQKIKSSEQRTQKIRGLVQGSVDIDKQLKTPEGCECGGSFEYVGLGVYKCSNCGNIFKNEYAIIRDFVDKYGTNYSILEISEMTGIEKRLIDLFIKDGKFVTVEKQRVCIICHQPIPSGIYCNRCALTQISDSMEENRRKNMSSSIRNVDMQGMMHHEKK